MSGSPVRPPGERVHLGSPVLPVNPPATYLRHRAAVERANRARRQALRRRRLLIAVVCGLLYLAIGRELITLALAKKGAMTTEMRRDSQVLAKDVEQIVDASKPQAASEITSPVAFTSAAALAGKNSPEEIDAWLSAEPIEPLPGAD